MRFKTLKSKTHPDTFAVFNIGEIFHSDIPILQPLTATMELMKEAYAANIMITHQLNDYNLVEVEVMMVEELNIKP